MNSLPGEPKLPLDEQLPESDRISGSSSLELLLLPGMHGTPDLYVGLMEALRKDWRSTALSYPTDVIVSHEQHLDLVQSVVPDHPFVLVAESYSTLLAIQYAACKPQNLKGLVLCVGFASCPLRGWRKVMASLLRRVLFHFPLTDFAIDHFLIGPNPPEALREAVRATVASVKPRVLSARLASILHCNVRACLREISIPILYLQAMHDRLVNAHCLEEILHENPRVRVEKIPGPHLLFHREPERAAEVIERFVSSILGILA